MCVSDLSERADKAERQMFASNFQTIRRIRWIKYHIFGQYSPVLSAKRALFSRTISFLF